MHGSVVGSDDGPVVAWSLSVVMTISFVWNLNIQEFLDGRHLPVLEFFTPSKESLNDKRCQSQFFSPKRHFNDGRCLLQSLSSSARQVFK